jgi:hypothetical protein
VLLRHIGDPIGATRIGAGTYPLVMLVAHEDKAGFAVFGEHDRFAAGGIGDVANLLVEIACSELSHGHIFSVLISIISRFPIFARNRVASHGVGKWRVGCERRTNPTIKVGFADVALRARYATGRGR